MELSKLSYDRTTNTWTAYQDNQPKAQAETSDKAWSLIVKK
jgi:hypothetical protein